MCYANGGVKAQEHCKKQEVPHEVPSEGLQLATVDYTTDKIE